MWSRCCSIPRRSPPNHSYWVSRPAARRQLVPARAGRPSPAARRRARSRRSGRGRSRTRPSRGASPGPPRSSGMHEVVGVGHVVRDEAEAVHPRVAELAARRAASGSGVAGFPTGKLGAPPGVRLALPSSSAAPRPARRPRPSAARPRPRTSPRNAQRERWPRRRARPGARARRVRAVVVRLVEQRRPRCRSATLIP